MICSLLSRSFYSYKKFFYIIEMPVWLGGILHFSARIYIFIHMPAVHLDLCPPAEALKFGRDRIRKRSKTVTECVLRKVCD